MEQIRIRRCWHLLCEPLQALQLDMAALLSGDGRPLLAVSHQWSALAAHLDGPVVLDDAQLALLGRLDREQWVPLAQLPDAAQRLLDTGLALAHNDQRQCACRDQQLRQAHWWGPAAVLSGTSALVALWLLLGWGQHVPALRPPADPPR